MTAFRSTSASLSATIWVNQKVRWKSLPWRLSLTLCFSTCSTTCLTTKPNSLRPSFFRPKAGCMWLMRCAGSKWSKTTSSSGLTPKSGKKNLYTSECPAELQFDFSYEVVEGPWATWISKTRDQSRSDIGLNRCCRKANSTDSNDLEASWFVSKRLQQEWP